MTIHVFRTFIRSILLIAVLVLSACSTAPIYELSDAEVWRRYEASLIAKGKLKTDRTPLEAPYDNEDLIRAFREIMFFDEFVREDSVYRTGRAERLLEKRTGPVGYSIWGAGVTETDRADLAEIAGRIQRATGLDLYEDSSGSDIEVLLLNRSERLSLAMKVRLAGAEAMAYDLENDLEGLVCAAYFFTSEEAPGIEDYTIIIPDELSGVLRKSCIEEEFGQAFGPSADYDGARPSIFNDDEEYAFFTEHDAWLFRILYDPRLKDGMDQQTAMPIVRQIAAELRPNG
ncbi:MAG: DUF2927 domain-containing protein [Pseudomonadota bacterium]